MATRTDTIRKVRAIIAKAESTAFPGERAVFRAKADELMKKYGLSAADVGPLPSPRRVPRRHGPTNWRTERNVDNVLAVVPVVPAGRIISMNALTAPQIASILSDKAGKVIWPVPTKKYLERLEREGKVKKVQLTTKIAGWYK